MPKRIDPAIKERAVRLVREHRSEYPSLTAAAAAVAKQESAGVRRRCAGGRAGDLLDRNFTAAAPDQTWVTDFTYVRTWTAGSKSRSS